MIDVLGINDAFELLGRACELIGGGYSAISIGGKSYLTATEAKVFKKFLVKMAQKYAGWLGVFIILHDYAICLDQNELCELPYSSNHTPEDFQ